MQSDSIVQFLTTVDECDSLERLMDAFTGILDDEGYGHFVVLRIPMVSETSVFRILHHQLPQDWVDFYMSRGYHLIDPVLRHLSAAQGYYRFADAYGAFEKDTHRRGIERLTADRTRFGIEDGYLFPVYGRLGLMGAITLSGRRSEVAPLNLRLLNAAVNHLFWRIVNLGDGEIPTSLPPSDQPVSMTRREKEVIVLLAEGLTSNEIARELSISNHTVDWYVNGLQDKLEARNRQHAISLAFRRGLLV